MRFIDRKNEMKELEELYSLSKKKLFAVTVYGLRRVGKTRLILESLKKKKGIYFFVNKNKTSQDLLKEYEHILKKNGILGELEVIDSWDIFIEIIISRNPEVIVFDEFQNFYLVEPAVFGMLQKNIDLNEGKPGMLVFSGSLVGLMKNTFQNKKEPLYGRIKKSRKLAPLSLSFCLEIGKELGMSREELIKTFGIFGGFPKYYVSIEDFNLQNKTAEEIIDYLFLAENAPLEDEVKTILSQEFGRRSGLYYSILESIATGNNTISEIAGYLNKRVTSITRQINELKDKFELIEDEMPFEGKKGVYRIRHPLMQFWFSQVYRNYSDYKSRNPEFIKKLKKNLNNYFGKAFEAAAKEFIVSKLELVESSRQWGKIQGAKQGENTYEIDLIGRGERDYYAFEFKWSELNEKEVMRVLKSLETKLGYVHGMPQTKLGIVGKRIKEKDKIRKLGYLVYDVGDF